MVRQLEESMLALPVSERRDHLKGPRTAAVTLVEYGDFECPHCGQAHFIIQQLMAHFAGQLRLVYRHFPLIQVHPHAERAAEAAESAGTQGQFWEMHDTLFEHQDALDDAALLEYAEALGLDLPRFEAELLQHVHIDRVREDVASGIQSGVHGTPTFYINGRRHIGPWDLDSLIAAIEPQTQTRGRPRGGRMT